jgi:MOSC domain-containing protein
VRQVPTVALISLAPVKSLALDHPEHVHLTLAGVAEDRRLYLVDDAGRLYNGTRHGPLVRVRATYDDRTGRMTLDFPDGRVGGVVELADAIETDFWGRTVSGRVVRGPWAEALSDWAGASLRLVRTDVPGDAADVHRVTMVSEESCSELARNAGAPVDARRFRMLFTLTGCSPHEEDEWSGRTVRIGGAVVRVAGQVPRCVVTTQDPETGLVDLDVLRTIARYRGRRDGDVAFGVYADVEEAGPVRVGDTVESL